MSLESTDNLIIQRGDSLYKVNKDNLMDKLQDDDLLIVARGSTNYKIKGSEFKLAIGGGDGEDISGNVSGGTLFQIRDQELDYDVRIFDDTTTDDFYVVSGD